MKNIFFFFLLTCILAFKVQETNRQNLQFNEVTEYFSPEFISTFRNYINSGSSFFKNDTQKKLEYISDGMSKNYPIDNRKYSIFMENETSYTQQSGYSIYPPFTFAGFAKGVDLSNPNLSYMLAVQYNWNRTFINAVGQKGKGLTELELEIISDEIIRFETKGQVSKLCAFHMGQYLMNQIYQNWSHFTSTVENSFAVSAYVFEEKFIYFKPARCYHLLYLKYPTTI